MSQFNDTNKTAKDLKNNFKQLTDFEALQIAVGIQNNIIQDTKIKEESKSTSSIVKALSDIADALKK